jgi:cysteinyl-tRNA synthetase
VPAASAAGESAESAALAGLVEARIAERAEARAAKDWARSDAIRDELAAVGVVVKDGANGATWTLA